MPTRNTGSQPVNRSDPPQVGGDNKTLSALTSSGVERAVASRKPRRIDRSVIPVRTTAMHTTSRRGLPWTGYFVFCPECEQRRMFIRPGKRLCACGALLDLATGAEAA